MNQIIKLCAIFDPIFIVTIGCAIVLFLLIKMFHELNEGNSDTKHIPLENCVKLTGTIVGYNLENETKIIERNGKKEQVIIQKKYPIVEYEMDNEIKSYTYNKAFYKDTANNVGYTFPVYIRQHNSTPFIKYDDIYYKESRMAEKITYIICGFTIILFGIITIFSIIGH